MSKKAKGYILLEALIAIAIMGFLVISILPSIGFLLQRFRVAAVNTDANLVLQEGMEVAYNVLSQNWDGYAPGLYKVAVDQRSGKPIWALQSATGPDLVDGKFNRTIQIEAIYRNPVTGMMIGAGDIDARSKRITITVRWDQSPTPITAQLLVVNTQ